MRNTMPGPGLCSVYWQIMPGFGFGVSVTSCGPLSAG